MNMRVGLQFIIKMHMRPGFLGLLGRLCKSFPLQCTATHRVRCFVQVYLGRWHSSEVAIKCLNPSLFFSGSDGSASKAAMADLMREADLLASLRHPNVVWVYGVVLPKMVLFRCHALHLLSLVQMIECLGHQGGWHCEVWTVLASYSTFWKISCLKYCALAGKLLKQVW